MQLLPKWVLPPTMPSIYDTESFTALEMVAKVYGATNELIGEYNAFADKVNKEITEFTESEQKSREAFEENITKVMREFVCSMERQFKTNLESTVEKLLNEAIRAGDLKITEVYKP